MNMIHKRKVGNGFMMIFLFLVCVCERKYLSCSCIGSVYLDADAPPFFRFVKDSPCSLNSSNCLIHSRISWYLVHECVFIFVDFC